MADYEDTKVTDLVINNMSQEKFEELKAAGELDPTQIYLTPTEESGGVSLPDQTDNAGKFLTTDGTTASWGEALSNHGTHAKSIAIGYNKQISTWTGDIYIGTSNSLLVTGKGVGGVIVIGDSADTLNDSCFDSIAIGKNAKICGKSAIQLCRNQLYIEVLSTAGLLPIILASPPTPHRPSAWRSCSSHQAVDTGTFPRS